jgi:hypothetical protein
VRRPCRVLLGLLVSLLALPGAAIVPEVVRTVERCRGLPAGCCTLDEEITHPLLWRGVELNYSLGASILEPTGIGIAFYL